MAKEFRFPDLGEGIAEGELVKWLVKEGDTVKEDQDVAEVETDKALVNIPSPHAGKVEKLHFKEGDKIPVGETLISFAEDGSGEKEQAPKMKEEEKKEEETEEKKEEPAAEKKEKTEKEPEKTPSSKEEKPDSREETPSAPEKKPAPAPDSKLPVLATPHTRKLARELGVDIDKVTGSGEKGRITEEDVRKFSSSGAKAKPQVAEAPPPSDKAKAPAKSAEEFGTVEKVPLKGIHRKISEHMLQTAQQTVMVTHIDEARVDALIQLRREKKKYAEERGVKLTLLPFLMKACVIALKNYPYLNASLVGEEIWLKRFYNFGFAVDTEAGLMVPVLRDVDQKSILRLAAELTELSAQARDRSIALEDLQGHSFSITNIGSIGGRAFTPVLHYPDSAILGLGRTYEAAVVVDGEIRVASQLPLCLTFDHRVTDGATAARFVNELIKYLGDPDLLLLDDGEA